MEREALAPMQISAEVTFPHASAHDLQASPARWASSTGDTEGLRIIFLMAVPLKTDYDDRILLRVCDEIIRLSGPALVRKVSRLNSYVQFYLMEDYTGQQPKEELNVLVRSHLFRARLRRQCGARAPAVQELYDRLRPSVAAARTIGRRRAC